MKTMKYKSGAVVPAGTTVYKKVYSSRQTIILTMIVTKPGICTNASNQQCRAPEVLVVDARDYHTGAQYTGQTFSGYDSAFKYNLYKKAKSLKLGTKIPLFDSDYTRTCTPGIHFFLTKARAKSY